MIKRVREPRALNTIKKVLMICGILSSLLYIGADILASMLWTDYSYTAQSVSELSAIGAPTRSLLVLLYSIYNVLVIAFGFGILLTDRRKRARLMGMLLIGYGIVGQVGLFFPMNLRGAEKTISDTMHIAFTGATVLFILLYIVLGATLHGKRFRLYSIGTILMLLLFGFMAGLDGPRIAAHLPTPGLGVMERINIYTSMLWILVMAIIRLNTAISAALTADTLSSVGASAAEGLANAMAATGTTVASNVKSAVRTNQLCLWSAYLTGILNA